MWIRPTLLTDLPVVMDLFMHARTFMAENGNPDQWVGHYPSVEMIQGDINSRCSYVCEVEGTIAGTFYFEIGLDPTYNRIVEGCWLNDRPYGVVHRIATSRAHRGVGAFCLKWCETQCANIRIDTHEANIPMRNLLALLDYTYCGKIYLENGDERLAYQRVCE